MNTKKIIFTLVLVVLSIFLVVVLVALYRDCSSLVCIRPSPSRNNNNNANQIRLSLSSSARERKKRNRTRMTRSSLWMRISRRICLQPWRKVRSGLSIPSRLLWTSVLAGLGCLCTWKDVACMGMKPGLCITNRGARFLGVVCYGILLYRVLYKPVNGKDRSVCLA